MLYIRKVITDIMRSWVGNESFKQEVIDIYNSISPLPRGYRLKDDDSCGVACISAAFQKAGYAGIFPAECSWYYMIANAIRAGIWESGLAVDPKPGDVVVYIKKEGKILGVVVENKGGTLVVIEGNGETAKLDKVKLNSNRIEGVITPKYSVPEVMEFNADEISDTETKVIESEVATEKE